MKKLFAVIISAAVMLSLCGCAVSKLPTYDELKGSCSGDTYENEYLGLKLTKPSDWTFMSDDEIAEMTGVTADLLEEGGVELEMGEEYYDMFLTDPETGNNISCILKIVGNTGEVDYAGALDEIEESIKSFGEAIGMSYTFTGHDVVELCGIEFHKFGASAVYEGMNFEQAGYVAVEKGVLINVNVTVMDGTPVADIESMFTE